MFSRTLGVSVAFSESFIQFLWKCLSVSLVTQVEMELAVN